MYRDPSEFRERFKAYKDGKSVREIYGLPGYEPGKVGEPSSDEVFVEQMGPLLYKELLYQGVENPDAVYKNLIAQLAYESDRGRSRLAKQQHNYGGVGYNNKTGTYFRYKNDADFVHDYVKLMNRRYKSAISADTLYEYAKRIRDLGYYEDTLENYSRNLIGMKSLHKAALAHKNANPDLYKVEKVPTQQMPPTIAPSVSTRVAATIPQEKTIPIADPRNATIAEAQRAMWAHTAFENIPKISDMPIWESPSLPALTPVEYDVAPLKTYAGGKLPGYQDGYILKGHKQIPIDDLGGWARHHDADEDYKTTYWKNVVGSGIDFVEGITNHWRRILNGRGTVDDMVDATIDVATGAAGKVVKDSAKRLIKNTKRAAKKAIKPTKASVKKSTMSAPEVAEYHKANPKLVKPVSVTPEVLKAVDYTYDRANRLSKEPLEKVNLNMQSAKFPENTNISAYATPYGTVFDETYIKEMQKMGIMVPHEYEHLLQQQIKYTPEQASILEQAFPFSSDWMQAHKDFDLLKERGAMNSELAYAIGKKYGFPVGKQFDNVVKKMPNSEMEEIASGLSAYNKHSSELRMTRPNVWPDVPSPNPAWNPLVRALTKVPATITVPLLAESQLDEYKDGKISINPANRGKFNATKKRTGKTTEELTHSKNPLTRKRAIFALNAKKWHHADGKLPQYGDGYSAAVELAKGGVSLIPGVGTAIDAYDFYNEPSLDNFGYLLLSGIGDAAILTGIGTPFGLSLKGLKTAAKLNKARKTLKAVESSTKANNAILLYDAKKAYRQAKAATVAAAAETGNLVDTGTSVWQELYE